MIMERISAENEIELIESAAQGLQEKINMLRDNLEMVDEEGADSDFIENQLSDYSDIVDSLEELLESLRSYEE